VLLVLLVLLVLVMLWLHSKKALVEVAQQT
jgi:hypothetical protein